MSWGGGVYRHICRCILLSCPSHDIDIYSKFNVFICTCTCTHYKYRIQIISKIITEDTNPTNKCWDFEWKNCLNPIPLSDAEQIN